jgi:hypothetical protein
MSVKCAECQCAPHDCGNTSRSQCQNCTLEVCCCLSVHRPSLKNLVLSKQDDCCETGTCQEIKLQKTKKESVRQFFVNAKSLYAAALGIEILCISAAETGENAGLYVLGFNHIGIPIAYAMGFGLSIFTTFVTILGRYQYGTTNKIDSCCSVLGQQDNKGFLANILTTFGNFGIGLRKLGKLRKQPNMKQIIKSSLIILITAESACILVAETVDLIFYKQYLYISIPLALFAGAFTVVAPEAYRKLRPN